MNDKKAKALRRQVYGSGSKRNEGQYKYDTKTVERQVKGPNGTCKVGEDGKPKLEKVKVMVGGFYCVGKRAEYLKLKKESKEARTQ